ncbi:MAG: 2'-5' RNA ligase family protein, partial [Shimia sp.]
MIYVLAYPEFEPDIAQDIAAFRVLYEPERAELVPPHLTLVFGVNAAHLPAVEALAVRAARDVPAFCVAFTGHVVEADP